MQFTIVNEPYTFTLEVDGAGNLTAFTATNGEINYDCLIQLTAIGVEGIECCGVQGCMSGPCSG